MSEPRALNVLLIAPCCDKTDVGESRSTWQWVKGLSEHHQVTLLTYHKRNRPRAKTQLPNTRVIEYRDLPIVGRFERFNSMLKPGYVSFYFKARTWIKKYLKTNEPFDIVHQSSPLALRYPTPVQGLNIPYIIGPLGGSLKLPPSFHDIHEKQAWYIKLRELDAFRIKQDPLLKRSYEGAESILGVGQYVKDLLSELSIRRFDIMSETGVENVFPKTSEKNNDKIRLLYVGRVIKRKGVRYLIKALSTINDKNNIHLDILGQGDDMEYCRQEINRQHLGKYISMHGQCSPDQVQKYYKQADVFVFPSLCEPSGNVVLEAMSNECVPIVFNYGGPGEVIDQRCGIKLNSNNPEALISDLGRSIVELVNNPDKIKQLGKNALKRIEDNYLWDKKINWMNHHYQQLIEKRRIKDNVHELK